MRANTTTPRGFTLVEMLIALVMSAVIVAPLYIITRSMSEQTGFRRLEVEAMQRARTGLNLLVRDFSRTGLFTSPNTGKDDRFLNMDAGGDAQFRAAAIHLNRNAPGNDAVLLTGNFLDSTVHRATYVGSSMFLVHSLNGQPETCNRLFDPAFAFVNITSPRDSQMDLRVTGIQTSDPCAINVEMDPATIDLTTQGEEVRLSANQTAIYRVESEQLVRYFVDYNSPITSPGVCTMANIDGTIVPETRRVLADDVLDFQVWFRVKFKETGNPDWNIPGYLPLSTISFSNGLLPPESWQLFTADFSTPPDDSDVGCDFQNNDVVGPEQVRSAVVRLTVKTQEPTYDHVAPTPSDGRLIQRNLAPGPNNSAFKLKTLITEIEMPNLASRSDL